MHTAAGVGEILSGTFSPTLGKGVALARVPAGDRGAVEVEIRGKRLPVREVRYPFVRDGVAQPGVCVALKAPTTPARLVPPTSPIPPCEHQP